MASPAGAGAAFVGPADRVAFFDEQRRNRRATWRLAAAAALVMINVAAKWTLFIFTSVVVGPMLALLWRARRYLADATAVQLTRRR